MIRPSTPTKICNICLKNVPLYKFSKNCDTCKTCGKQNRTSHEEMKTIMENQMRKCDFCPNVKDLKEFSVSKGKPTNRCTECSKEYQKELYEKKKAARIEEKGTYKYCNTCTKTLLIENFEITRGSCRECEKSGIMSPDKVRELHKDETKKCQKCTKNLSTSSFEVTKNGFRNKCKVCREKSRKEAKANKPEVTLLKKMCSKCHNELSIDNFSPHSRANCKKCKNDAAKASSSKDK
jgi:hypothetical protein